MRIKGTYRLKQTLKSGSLTLMFMLLLVSLHAQVPFTCEGQFYITLQNGLNSQLMEVEIDPFTQQVNFVSIRNNLGIEINSIGYRNEENLIYGIDPSRGTLYRLDANGSVETLTTLPLNSNYTWLAADITPDGRYLILVGGTNQGVGARDFEIANVDLSLPGYPVVTRRVGGAITRIYDIAFDPLTGILYGFDSANNRLATIDWQSGVVSAPFGSTNLVENAGSLFFTAFGELFAYGGLQNGIQSTLYLVDKDNGVFEAISSGPAAEGTDACSCPFTLEMIKTVAPETVVPCDDVVYTFGIANGSGRTQDQITISDPLPRGFTFEGIVDNPFGGTVVSIPGDDFLRIEGMSIPVGIDSILVRVNVGKTKAGTYKNQAVLSGLSESLGRRRLSDYPRTLVDGDSTPLVIKGIPFDTLYKEGFVCSGLEETVDVTEYGDSFLWDDGQTVGRRGITEAGRYEVQVIAGCDTAVVIYDFDESGISIELLETDVELKLGDSVLVNPIITNQGNDIFYQWIGPDGNPIMCGECTSLWLRPFFSGQYIIRVTNEDGCVDEAILNIRVLKNRIIYVPNTFTPQGDGINDRFFVHGKGFGFIESFQIFDRWGELVYNGPQGFINDESIGWDGKFNNENVLPGVYVWKAEIRYLDDIVETRSGDITVLR